MSSEAKGQSSRRGQARQGAAPATAKGRAAPARQAARAAAPVIEVTPELINRARREVSKARYMTPFRLSQALSINMSIARKLLKRLVAEGVLRAVAKNRRLIVAVPLPAEGAKEGS